MFLMKIMTSKILLCYHMAYKNISELSYIAVIPNFGEPHFFELISIIQTIRGERRITNIALVLFCPNQDLIMQSMKIFGYSV